jgi:hypothetical protein
MGTLGSTVTAAGVICHSESRNDALDFPRRRPLGKHRGTLSHVAISFSLKLSPLTLITASAPNLRRNFALQLKRLRPVPRCPRPAFW